MPTDAGRAHARENRHTGMRAPVRGAIDSRPTAVLPERLWVEEGSTRAEAASRT